MTSNSKLLTQKTHKSQLVEKLVSQNNTHCPNAPVRCASVFLGW